MFRAETSIPPAMSAKLAAAHDVEKVFPEWFGIDDKGYKTLGFIGFEALTAEAINELQLKINSQDKKIMDLEKEIEKLKNG